MPFKKYAKKINIDFEVALIKPISAKQGDVNSRFLEFTIYNQNELMDLTGLMVKFYAKKPDGKEVFNNCTIEEGKVLVELTSQLLVVDGVALCELMIFNGEGIKLTSKTFNLNIERSVNTENAIESSNEYDTITGLILDVNQAKEHIGVLGSLNDTLNDTIRIAITKDEILNQTISLSDTKNQTLIDTINNAELKNEELLLSILNANSKKEEVETTIGLAEEKRLELENMIDTAESSEYVTINKGNELYAPLPDFNRVSGEFEDMKNQIAQNKPILIDNDMPVGSIVYKIQGAAIPTGWLWCDGRQLNKVDYPELFNAIQYTYGGSGEVFNIPKLIEGDSLVTTGLKNGNFALNEVKQIQGIIKAKKLGDDMVGVAQQVEQAKGLYNTLAEAMDNKLDKTNPRTEGPLSVTGRLHVDDGTATPVVIYRKNSANLGVEFKNQNPGTEGSLFLGSYNGNQLKVGPSANLGSEGYYVYHEGKKPTPKEIGAVASAETTLINSRNSTHKMFNANVNGYPCTGIVIDDLDNSANNNGLYYLLGNGVPSSPYEHNSLRPKNVNSSNKNCLGQVSAPWDELYLKGKVLSKNGYSKMPNGLIIQWGEGETIFNGNYSESRVTFPISFPNAMISITPNTSATSFGGSHSAYIYGIGYITNSYVNIISSVYDSSTVTGRVTYKWIAIGY